MQFADVAGADLVINDSDHHEQRGLECSMRKQQNNSGLRDVIVAGAEQQHHEAKLADRAVRQEQLEIVLTKRPQSADQHRGRPDRKDDHTPVPRDGEHRGKAGHKVYARLDHGRRVQIRADRRGCDHGTWEPTAERRLSRLREGSDQDTDNAGIDDCPGRRIDDQL